MKINFDQEKIFLASVAIGGFALISFMVLLCFPLAEKIQSQHKQQQAYRQETVALKKVLSTIKEYKFQSHLLNASKVQEVLEQILKVGTNHQVAFNLTSEAQEDSSVDSKLYKRMTVSFNISGTYKDIGKFLSDIRNLPDTMIDIDQMRISSNLADTTRIMAHIKLGLYFSKDNET